MASPQASSAEDASVSSSSIGYICAIFAFGLLMSALAFTSVRAWAHSRSQFTGAHAFVSADVSTTARTFASEGVWKLRGVPVNNNPPIGLHDSYTHWPPLLPVLLGGVFRMFGSSEHTAHIFMLCILLMTALLLARIGWLWLGPVGALAGYFWLTLPVVVQFGDLVAQESLAMLFVVAAMLAFYSGRTRFGALLVFLGFLSSWEAALIVPGIWLAFPRRTAVMATLGAGAGFLGVATLFILGSPELAADALQTVKFYAGLSPVYSHMLPHDRAQLGFAEQLSGVLWNHLWMLGALGLASVIQLFSIRPRNGLLVALSAPWLLWTVVMRTHVAIHDFELLIAAPIVALALTWLATTDIRTCPSWNSALKTGAICTLAFVQAVVLPMLRPKEKQDYSPERIVRYGLDIRNSTEPDSIVLAPLESSVPIFYSERHIVRGIDGDTSIHLPQIRAEFQGSSVYLAIPPVLAGRFAETLSHATIVASTEDTIVARL